MTVYEDTDYRSFLKTIHTDFINTVKVNLPTFPKFGSVYSSILGIGLKLGRKNPDQMYFEMFEATRTRSIRSKEDSCKMRRVYAEQIAAKWKAKINSAY